MTSENVRRAKEAKKVLAKDSDFKYDPKASLVDLLTNLMHYCNEAGLDFDDSVRVAKDHFSYEASES